MWAIGNVVKLQLKLLQPRTYGDTLLWNVGNNLQDYLTW
jgi:hypothetical protein